MTQTQHLLSDPSARHNATYRWLIIILCAATATIVTAVPTAALSVLFQEIKDDLDLTIVQIGFIWSTRSMTGLLLGILGGALADRFGARTMLIIACVMIGVFGAARGLTSGYNSFLGVSLLMGIFTPMIGVNLHKVASEWFAPSQLGFANSIIGVGFAGGFFSGSILGARILSPLFGGWRPVLYFLGGISIVLGLLWYFLHPKLESDGDKGHDSGSLLKNLPQIMRLRSVRMISIGKLCVWACITGFTGYLPLYLRGQGWESNQADTALGLFYLVSLFGSIPLVLLCDHFGVRKQLILVATVFIGVGVILMTNSSVIVVFGAALAAGLFFDAYMSITITAVADAKGVGPALAGTAIGFLFMFQDIGGIIGPVVGNRLADINPQLPFYFWGGMALIGLIFFVQYEADS